MMLETWRKCPKVNKADMGQSHLLAVLLSTDDRRKTVILTPSENLFDMAWTKEQMLEMREKKRGPHKRTLRNDPTLLDVRPGFDVPDGQRRQSDRHPHVIPNRSGEDRGAQSP